MAAPEAAGRAKATANKRAVTQPLNCKPGQWVWAKLMRRDAARDIWQVRVKASVGGFREELAEAVVSNFEIPGPTVDKESKRQRRAENSLMGFQRCCGPTPDCPMCVKRPRRSHSKASAGVFGDESVQAVVSNFQIPGPTVDKESRRPKQAESSLKAFQSFCGLTPDCPVCVKGQSRSHSRLCKEIREVYNTDVLKQGVAKTTKIAHAKRAKPTMQSWSLSSPSASSSSSSSSASS